MIVQVAPVEKNVGETVASLSFAQRVRSVELGQATKKVTEGSEVTEANGGHAAMNGHMRPASKTSATPAKVSRKR